MFTECRLYSKIVTIDNADYEILCIPYTEQKTQEEYYDFYIQPADRKFGLANIFALPASQQSLEEAFDLAAYQADADFEIITRYWF